MTDFFRSSNALPLISRGQYAHLVGYNKGQPYTLLDFYQVQIEKAVHFLFLSIQGAHIDFDTRAIMSLPSTVRHRTKLTISITGINEQDKQTLL